MYPKRRSNVQVSVVGGETVVLDRDGSRVHQLNETATFIWGRCEGRLSQAALAQLLGEAFDVDPKTAAKDTEKLIARLQELNLLDSGSDG